MLFLIAAPQLTFGGGLSKRAERLCLMMPCAVIAGIDVYALAHPGGLALSMGALKVQASSIILGYLVVRFAYIGLRRATSLPIEAIVAAFLLPVWMSLLRIAVDAAAFATLTPILVLWAGFLIWLASLVAVFAMLRVVAWPREAS